MQRRTLLRHSLQGMSVAGLAWFTGNAYSQSTIPAELLADWPTLQSAGTTRLKFFGLSVYDARLFTSPGFQLANYPDHTLALELTYLRTLYGKAIAERSIAEMRRAKEFPAAQEARWLADMQSAFPDVKAQDRITGVLLPGRGARFFFNGQLRATLTDPLFAKLFFGIWLADWTSEPKLRAELLAGAKP